MNPSIRPDIPMLTKLVDGGCISDSFARECVALPLFILPSPKVQFSQDFDVPRVLDTNDAWSCWFAENIDRPCQFVEEAFPFTDFMLLLDYQGNDDPSILARVKFIADMTIDFMVAHSTTSWLHFTFSMSEDDDAPAFKVLDDSCSDDRIRGSLNTTVLKRELSKGNLTPAQVDDLTRVIDNRQYLVEQYAYWGAGQTKIFTKWVEYNNQQDRYVTTVTPAKLPKFDFTSRKGRLAKVAGPTVVYLDKLPTLGTHTSTNEGVDERAPHHRKGHFRTLRADCYKNHPLYLKEKAVYVKPAFIGERTAEFEGQIYTVVDR